jgi:ABC-2 type transport system permease protein
MNPHEPAIRARARRILGLIRKETLQILRDPSSFLIAGVLPPLLLLIFAYGVTLDLRTVPIGVVVESVTPEATSLVASFRNSRYFEIQLAHNRREVEDELASGRLKGIVVLAADFSDRLGRGETAPIQLLLDGSDPNTAGLVQFYVQGLWANWLVQESMSHASLAERPSAVPLVRAETRIWFNPNLNSHYALLPGAVGIVLTLIGTLLTSLVVAREWERGTMEALLATPINPSELIVGKVVPYFALGMAAMALSVAFTVFVLGVPFRGSIPALAAISSAYLAVMLALGLLISTVTRNQFAASQAALIIGFLPALELSGFIFEIDSMPAPIRALTYVLPPRYFVASLQTLFLSGDVVSVLAPSASVLCVMAAFLFFVLWRKTRMHLE